MAAHFSVLAWRVRWIGEPGGLQSMGSQRVRRDWVTKHTLVESKCKIYVIDFNFKKVPSGH